MRSIILCLLLLSPAFAQTNLETTLTDRDQAVLEQLISLAQQRDPVIQQARVRLEPEIQLLGRLSEALTISAGASVTGDFYEQVSPSYSISVRLDVLALMDGEQTSVLNQQLAEALRQKRLLVVDAFIRYQRAKQAATAAVLALESADAQFRVVQARVKVGEATLSDELSSQTRVSDAAVALHNANTEVVLAFENLAATVGLASQTLKDQLDETP